MGGTGISIIVNLSRVEGFIRSSGSKHGWGSAGKGISNVLGIFADG
jgi:hypothetical protein